MIKTVIKSKSNMVLVFDETGEQLPEYQGDYENVKDNILREASALAAFSHWSDLAGEPQPISKEEW